MSARSPSYRFSAGPASRDVRGTSRLNDDARTVGRVKASALVGPGARFQGLKMRRGLGVRYGLRLAASRRKANPRFHTHRGDQQAGHCTLHTAHCGWWPLVAQIPGRARVVCSGPDAGHIIARDGKQDVIGGQSHAASAATLSHAEASWRGSMAEPECQSFPRFFVFLNPHLVSWRKIKMESFT